MSPIMSAVVACHNEAGLHGYIAVFILTTYLYLLHMRRKLQASSWLHQPLYLGDLLHATCIMKLMKQ